MPVTERKEFAERCETTFQHFKNVAYGKDCSPELAINMERESEGALLCETSCPNVDWATVRNPPNRLASLSATPR